MFSLVTACMNRDHHLRQVLPRWLALDCVREVVVVDWSNATPLVDLVRVDPRVKVVRVVNEPRWILSYAYNLGVAHASSDLVLKCDADCTPAPGIREYGASAGRFHAGFWRSGQAAGKPSVNGQCVFTKAQFLAVNGYSELIRTYGRDDEDFYDRLIAAGHARQEIDVRCLEFLDHTDEDRLKHQVAATPIATIDDFLARQPGFHEMSNLYLGKFMPWGPWFSRAVYDTIESAERVTIVKRDWRREIPVPAPVAEQARLFGLRCITGNVWNLPRAVSDRLEESACLQLIAEKLRAR